MRRLKTSAWSSDPRRPTEPAHRFSFPRIPPTQRPATSAKPGALVGHDDDDDDNAHHRLRQPQTSAPQKSGADLLSKDSPSRLSHRLRPPSSTHSLLLLQHINHHTHDAATPWWPNSRHPCSTSRPKLCTTLKAVKLSQGSGPVSEASASWHLLSRPAYSFVPQCLPSASTRSRTARAWRIFPGASGTASSRVCLPAARLSRNLRRRRPSRPSLPMGRIQKNVRCVNSVQAVTPPADSLRCAFNSSTVPRVRAVPSRLAGISSHRPGLNFDALFEFE
jgi:hypothetical protein